MREGTTIAGWKYNADAEINQIGVYLPRWTVIQVILKCEIHLARRFHATAQGKLFSHPSAARRDAYPGGRKRREE